MRSRYRWVCVCVVSLGLSTCQSNGPASTSVVTDAVAAPERTGSVDLSPMVVTMTPASQRVVPTETPAATVTLEPTAVPLASAGSYLLVTRSDANSEILTALDPDGVGRQRIDLPAGYELRHSLVQSFSSQGRITSSTKGKPMIAGRSKVSDCRSGVFFSES